MSHQSGYVEVEIEEIQISAHRSANAAPLILFHDGGGTVFSYYLLGDLNRNVYGIADPFFATANSWTGGVREMAEAYASSIWDKFTQRPLLLGGTSEMCEWLNRIRQLTSSRLVSGRNPLHRSCTRDAGQIRCLSRRHDPARHTLSWGLESSPVIDRGSIPGFTGEGIPGDQEAWTEGRPLPDMPPALLVRASDRVPVANDATCVVVDIHRHDRMLGWECCRHEWIREVVDINANHYNIFDDSNKVSHPVGSTVCDPTIIFAVLIRGSQVSYVSEAIRSWCNSVERVSP
ncbi:unnamed protein product [Aspergillus oryzae]|uniref:Unnamed protein product n=1 Tax=Aspergillus oryzae TaxID=5062 RepID=A0AAN4YWI5_ASPOZ|nr:unnamed protein product [Aspergillus oryzae]